MEHFWLVALTGLALWFVISSFVTKRRSGASKPDPAESGRLLCDDDPVVREKAAATIGMTRSQGAETTLIQALEKEGSPEVRAAIIRAITRLGISIINQAEYFLENRPADGALSMGANSNDYLESLRKMLPVLSKSLESADPNEREAAQLALAWLGAPGASVPDLPPPLSPSPEAIQISAYYPPEVDAGSRFLVHVYVFEQTHLLSMFRRLGEIALSQRGGSQALTVDSQRVKLAWGTPITVVVECDTCDSEPCSLTATWDPSAPLERGWLEFVFRLTPGQGQADFLMARFSVQVHAIEVASIAVRIELTTAVPARASLRHTSRLPYQSIFVSYSRQDAAVVNLYRAAQSAVGNDVFVDTYSIRSGANWRKAIATAIDTADVFQLFWSKDSANSSNVHEEWTRALSRRGPALQGGGFIRPVYWLEPIPAPPPPELAHLHFRYEPLLGATNTVTTTPKLGG